MAKYRISSIPQSLPKNQFGGLFKKRKKKDNSIINYTPPSEETMVQGIEPQNGSAYMFGSPDLPTAEQFPTYDIGPQDYSRPRTPEEEANTFAQPFNWTQGETIPAYEHTYNFRNPLRNPVTERSYQYSLQRKLGMPYTGNPIEQRTIQMPEQFIPDYHAPFTETGDPLSCGEGKIPYKGQCITKEAFEIIRKRELDQEDFAYQQEQEEKKKKFELEINEIRRKNKEEADRLYNESIKDYFTNFSKSKKQDKQAPFEKVWSADLQYMVPVLDNNGQPIIDDKTGKPKMETAENHLKKAYLINKTENGYTELYPLEIVYDRINNNGFFNNEFEQYWGLDPKQVKEQLGDIQKAAKSQYDATVSQKIMDKSLSQGISPAEAAQTFSTKLGYASNFLKQHAPEVQKKQNELYESYIKESLKNLEKEIGVKLDEDGTVRYDPSKKDAKQNVKFDFWDNVYKDTYDDSGALTSREFDPIGNYAQAWINSAPNETEKAARRKKVNAVYASNKYNEAGKKAYEESLNAPGSYWVGDPFEGMTQQEITNMYGDRMQSLKSGIADQYNNIALGPAIDAKTQTIKQKKNEELAKLTGFNKDFETFMKNHNRQSTYLEYRNAFQDPNISASEKSKVLSELKKNNAEGAMSILMNRPAQTISNSQGSPTYASNLGAIFGMDHYYNMVNGDRVTAGSSADFAPIGLGTKIWDVVTNPGDALYYGLNQRGESMWGDWNKSYNERKEAERRFGVDLGTYKDFGPTYILDMLNSFNPANWADELSRGYEANGMKGLGARTSDLTWKAITDASYFVPGAQGLALESTALKLAQNAQRLNALKNTGTLLNRAVNAGSRGLNTFGRGMNYLERGLHNYAGYPGKYLVNFTKNSIPGFAVEALRPYGDFHQGLINLSEGNIGEGLGDISMGALSTLPLGLKTYGSLKSLNDLKNPNTVLTMPNFNTRYSLSYNAATPGSGLLMGNPNTLIPGVGQPKFQYLTNPINRFSKGLGFGEFNINTINPGWRVTPAPQTTNLLQEATVIPEEVQQTTRRPFNFKQKFFKGSRIKTQQYGGSTGNPIIDSLRQLGYQNEAVPGNLSAQLTDAEIEQYVKGGYIIEDE